MSAETVAVVRRAWEAWDTDDLGGMLAVIDEGMVTRRVAPLPDPGTWHGPEGFLEMAAEWFDHFDDYAMSATEFIDAGDQVVVRVEQAGRARDSRVPITTTQWWVFGVRNGRIITSTSMACTTRPSKPPGCAGRPRGAAPRGAR